jgi:hypothetical protein
MSSEMLEAGKTYPLSHFIVGDCGLMNGKEFMVVQYTNGDRVSDVYEIVYRIDNSPGTFSTDYNCPNAIYLGKGERIITYKWVGP